MTSAPPLLIDQQPASGCVIVGQTVTLVVASPPAAVSWSSEMPSIATVDASSGVVRGVSAGQATISARSANRSGTTPVCVVGPLGNVPQTLAVTAGQTAQLSPSGTSGATVTYTSDNTDIATVSSSGLVTGVGPGEARIATKLTAASGSEEATTVVTVSAASITIEPNPTSVALGAQQALTATARDVNGGALQGVDFSWTVDDPTTVQLVGTSGNPVQVKGLKLGATSVRVTGAGASGAVQVTVTRGAPASITVALSTASLTIGGTTAASAEVKDATGNTLDDQTVSWTTTDGAVVTASSTGARTATITAVGAGSAGVVASIGAVSGKATIQVSEVPIATLTLTPPSATISAGGAGQVLTAVPRDAQGNVLVGRTVAWSTGDASVVNLSAASSISTANGATVTVAGAKAGGPITVTATSGGENATAQITVTPGAPVSITLSPTSVNLTIEETVTVTAVVKDAQGAEITSLPSGVALTWSETGSSVVTVNATPGQPFKAEVEALNPGTANVTASLPLTGGGTIASNAVVISVLPYPPAHIVADSPNNPVCAVNNFDCQFAVKVTNSLGQPVEGAEVEWTSNVGCDGSYTIPTDAAGRSAIGNTCTTNIPGSYTQTARLVATNQQVTFDFQFVGFPLQVQPLANSTGNGRITSTTNSIWLIDCTITAGSADGDCVANFGPNMAVTLTASPTDGSIFAGWGGSTCAEGGTTQPQCTVTLSQARSLTVNFAPVWETATLISTSSPAPGVTRVTYRVPSRGGVINGIVFQGVEYPAEQQYKDFISGVSITGATSTPTTVTWDDCTCGRPPGSSSQFYVVFTTTTPGVELNPVWYVFSSTIPAAASAPRSSGDATGLAEQGRPVTGPTSVPSTPLFPSGSASRPPNLDADAVSLKRLLAKPSPRAVVNPELLRNGRTGTRR